MSIRGMRWPPFGLGLGSPANLALLSAERRRRYLPTALLAVLSGVLTALTMVALDHLLFAGASVQRVRALGQLSWLQRAEIVAFSATTEEIAYRLVLATAISALIFPALRKRTSHAAATAMWVSIVVAALLFGLAHVANLRNVPHPYARAIVLNGIAGLVLGYLYWFRGLEAAIIAHLAADATIYLILASLL